MRSAPTIHTPRLHLRLWRDEDLAAFAALNADPRVMEFFPRPLDRAGSDARAARIRDHFARHGFGLWAVEVPGVADFIGFVGLSVPDFEMRLPGTLGPTSRYGTHGGNWPGTRLMLIQ